MVGTGEAAASLRRGTSGVESAEIGCGGVAMTDAVLVAVDRQRRVADATAAIRPVKSAEVSWRIEA